MIQFQKVSKSYGTKKALTNIDLSIEPGELVFIQGHSGAGKSTFLRLIASLEPASTGQIIINNQPLHTMHRKALPFYRRHLGLIFQSPLLLEDRTIYENVILPLQIGGFDEPSIHRRAQAALNRVGLLDKINDYPKMLSSGEQQRVSIARAVIHKPKILLADEPTGNLDPRLSFEIMTLFQRLQQVGVTVVIASHDTYLLDHFPFRKITIEQGEIVPNQPNQEVLKDHG